MSKIKNRYCIYCGSKLSYEEKRCSKCHKKVNSIDNLFFKYLKEQIKDNLIGNVEDSVFSILTNFIRSHLYGTILVMSIVVTVIGSNIILYNQDDYIEYVQNSPLTFNENVDVDEKTLFLDFASVYFDALENKDIDSLKSFWLQDKILDLGYVSNYELSNHIDIFYAKPEMLLNDENTPAYCAYHDDEVDNIIQTYNAIGIDIRSNDSLYINIRNRLTDLGYSVYSCYYTFYYCVDKVQCDSIDNSELSIDVKVLFVNYHNKIYVADEVVSRNNYEWNDINNDFDYIEAFYRNGGDVSKFRREIRGY